MNKFIRVRAIAVAFGLALTLNVAGARSGSSHHHSTRITTHTSHAASGVRRDTSGKIHRSTTAKNEFKKTHPCPAGGNGKSCKGYVIDHFVPLKRGGADAPSNMQWQSTKDAKAKDKVE